MNRTKLGRRASGSTKTGLLVAIVVAAAVAGWWWWKIRPGDGGAPGTAASAPASAASGAAGAGAGARRFGGASLVQPVSIEAVRRRDIRVTVNAIGSIAAYNTATVRAQVSGVLQVIRFKEGQQVRAGEQLAQIDPRAFEAALAQADGALARDRATLDNARLDLTRYRDLLAKDAIPSQQLDTQQALVRQLEGTVKLDQANVDTARLQLSYTKVLAPISGRVGLKQVDLGNVVQTTDPNGVVVITQTRPIALVFSVPSVHLPRIAARLRANQPVPVAAYDRSGASRLAAGRVASLDNTIDATTDTVKVKAVFANEDDALFPNQAVSVSLQLDTLVDTLAVPQAAVQRGAKGFYVYVVGADSTVGTRVVKPGAVDGDWMAVEGTLQPGERVVIDGVDRLREGAKVEVIAADPSKRAGAAAPPGSGRRGGRASGASGAASGASAASSGNASSRGDASPASAPLTAPGIQRGASAAVDAAGERPAWMDRLPPEVADKLMKMSPDERREWIRKRREERAKQGDAGQ